MNRTTMSLVDDFLVTKAAPSHHRRANSLTFAPSVRMESIGRSFSYSKLPEEPLKLSVLKLDGSSFEIEIMRSATIAELRQAVEAAFSHMPKEGPGKISWPHVWGHFCMCYDGQKLVAETDYIRNYGIKDGDQLQFIRHISSSYTLTKKQSTKRVGSTRQQNNSLRSNGYEEIQQNDEKDDYYSGIRNGRYRHNGENDDRIVRRTFPYSGCDFFATFRRIIQFCIGNHYSDKKFWRK